MYIDKVKSDYHKAFTCRICNAPGDNCYKYCLCSGKLAFMHLDCLKLWVKNRGYGVCEHCGYAYKKTGRFDLLVLFIRLFKHSSTENMSSLISTLLILFFLTNRMSVGLPSALALLFFAQRFAVYISESAPPVYKHISLDTNLNIEGLPNFTRFVCSEGRVSTDEKRHQLKTRYSFIFGAITTAIIIMSCPFDGYVERFLKTGAFSANYCALDSSCGYVIAWLGVDWAIKTMRVSRLVRICSIEILGLAISNAIGYISRIHINRNYGTLTFSGNSQLDIIVNIIISILGVMFFRHTVHATRKIFPDFMPNIIVLSTFAIFLVGYETIFRHIFRAALTDILFFAVVILNCRKNVCHNEDVFRCVVDMFSGHFKGINLQGWCKYIQYCGWLCSFPVEQSLQIWIPAFILNSLHAENQGFIIWLSYTLSHMVINPRFFQRIVFSMFIWPFLIYLNIVMIQGFPLNCLEIIPSNVHMALVSSNIIYDVLMSLGVCNRFRHTFGITCAFINAVLTSFIIDVIMAFSGYSAHRIVIYIASSSIFAFVTVFMLVSNNTQPINRCLKLWSQYSNQLFNFKVVS